MDWPNFFRGIFYSVLPKNYWGSWRPSSTVDFVRSAAASGMLECVGCLLFLIRGYLHFLAVRAHQMEAAYGANEGTQLYFLVILSLEYAIHPLTLIGLFLAGEGAIRACAAFISDEVVPSFPVRLVAFLQARREAKLHAAALGPEIPDVFERFTEGDELRISAQRPKDGWRISTIVAVEGEFYEVARMDSAAPPRPIIYILRKLREGKVMRGMYRYDPPETQ